MTWLHVGTVGDIEDGEALKIDSVVPPIAVYYLDGEYYSTADTCSHGQSSLSEGYVEEGTVECVWHMAKFCLRTGAAETLPATDPIRTYEVKIEDEAIYVLLDDSVIHRATEPA